MYRRKLPGFFTPMALLAAAVFGYLAYVALSERAISAATRGATHHYEGRAAVRVGFFYVACALASLGALATYHRYRNLIWLGLGVLWLGGIGAYASRAG